VAILNGKLRRRIEGLERSLAPVIHSNPRDEMMQLALSRVSTEDMLVLWEMTKTGNEQTERTERESAAVQAVASAYDQEVKRAGFCSIAAFQLSKIRLAKGRRR
jgi:hypothetical protein